MQKVKFSPKTFPGNFLEEIWMSGNLFPGDIDEYIKKDIYL